MAENKLNLSKKIISNKLSNKIYNKSFNNLTKSSPLINDENVRDLYDSIFYDIKKKGKNSHTSIVEESTDYLYPQINKSFDTKIENLVERINEKNEELTKLKNARPSNPNYPNGSFITAGDENGQFQGMQTVYVMQDGLKRAIKGGGMYHLIRRALKIPGEAFSELYFLSVNELNQIPDGVTIEYQWHLSMPEFAANYGPVYQRFPYYELHLYCEGREAYDNFDLVDGNFWLDDDPEDACTVTYIKNTFDGDPEQYSIETETINVGEKKVIEFARNDIDRGINGIPPQITKETYENYYDYNIDIQSSGTRLWGKDRKYEGILLAEGRLFIGNNNDGEKFNTRTNSPIIADIQYDELILGNRKIYSNGCLNVDGNYVDCFGDLNQRGEIADLLSGPTSPQFEYYRTRKTISLSIINSSYNYGSIYYFNQLGFNSLVGKNFNIYGQPILRVSGAYFVYLTTTSGSETYHHFYNLKTAKLNRILDSDIADFIFDKQTSAYRQQAQLQSSNSLYRIGVTGPISNTRFNWEAVDVSKVAYVGLATEPITGAKNMLNGYPDGNYFNPYNDGGSNYGISEETLAILESHTNNESYNDTSSPNFCPFTRAQLEQFELVSIPVGGGDLPLGCTFQNCIDC